MNRLRDSVERWLIQENYSFKETNSLDDNFKMTIKHVGSYGNLIEIFEPKKQHNVLVIGTKIPLKNNQNARFLNLTNEEQKRFRKKVSDFCYSIRAIHKFF